MTAKKKRDLGAILVESMAEAVAIERGTLPAARRHQRTLGEVAVRAPRPDPVALLAKARTFRQDLKIQPLTDRELRAARRAGRA